MTIGVDNAFRDMSEPSKRLRGRLASRHRHRVEKHRRHGLERGLDLDRFTLGAFDRAERRADVARHCAEPDQPLVQRRRSRDVNPVGDENSDASRTDAAVAGPGEQRKRGRHFDLRLRRLGDGKR